MLWLVGMMGSGKTTVGIRVAAAVERMFLDTDSRVEILGGCTIREIFDRDGEERFRALESAVIEDVVATEPPSVVATGGGAVMTPTNVATMRGSGTVVWLSAAPETLAHRLEGRVDRPLLLSGRPPEEVLAAMLSERSRHYQAAAHLVVEVDGRPPEEISEEVILRWIGS